MPVKALVCRPRSHRVLRSEPSWAPPTIRNPRPRGPRIHGLSPTPRHPGERHAFDQAASAVRGPAVHPDVRHRAARAARGGGHSGPGLGSVNDGLVIDLSTMKGVRVDPANKTVRVEPGCTSGDVDHATHPFGLAVPFGIVSTTGVAGLTLGGGTGYLTRKYGLTIDNLLEADVVLANGTFVTASKTQNPDLFWALRGGGGNFGVVTSFLFQAHPVDIVYAGPIFWEATHAKAVMRAYRDFLPTAPEELGAFVGLKTVPSLDPFPKDYWGRRACAVISSYNGPAEEGAKLMARLLESLPPPIFNWMGEMPFPAMQALFDPFFPNGLH